jgi:hypothetical protein
MASLMLEADEGDLLLCDEDFPDNFIHMMHPDDGKITKEPIQQEFIRNKRLGHHRLIFRTSIKLGENEFISLSFVLDTGAPSSIYFSPGTSVDKLVSCRRIIEDGDVVYMDIDGKKAAVKDTPHTRRPANIIGLPLLERWSLSLQPDKTFSFSHRQDKFL